MPVSSTNGAVVGHNVWGERGDTERLLRGHPKAAKYLATKLLEAEFDTALPGVKEASEVAELLLRLESMLATYR